MRLLAGRGAWTPGGLATAFPRVTPRALSGHLACLRRAGLIAASREHSLLRDRGTRAAHEAAAVAHVLMGRAADGRELRYSIQPEAMALLAALFGGGQGTAEEQIEA